MIPTTTVNGLTVVHCNSDGTAITGPPDVCNTPGAGPVPYVNIAFSRDLILGSVTVRVDHLPIALKESVFSTSYGDEPGTLGGVISHVNKGLAKFLNYSMDTFVEGRNVCRLSDPMLMNGNQYNSTNPAEVQGNISGDLKDILCKIFCWCDAGKNGGDFVQKVPYSSNEA
jgi:uncharacterized protein DUF4150